MILLLNNQYNPNFRSIQLNAKDTESARFAINKLLDTNLNYREKQTLQNCLFNVFDKQLQREAKIKTRATLIYKEVLAELLNRLFIALTSLNRLMKPRSLNIYAIHWISPLVGKTIQPHYQR